MENNTNKSQAEIYREERKQRLAKAAAKNAKKSHKNAKAKKVVGKVIAIVLAVVLGLGAIGGILNFFGTAEKVIKISTADKTYSFKVGEFNYYYFKVWSNYQNQAYQYDSYYGAGFGAQILGYDYTVAPSEQPYLEAHAQTTGISPSALGVKNPTWADLFKYTTVSQMIQIKYGAQKAAEAGIVLTAEQTKEIDDEIASVTKTAKDLDFSLDRYLRAQYGNGVTEKLLRQSLAESTLAGAFFDKLKTDFENGVTDDQVAAKYDENKNDYDIASIRLYEFTTDAVKAEDGATDEQKKAAQDAANAETKAKADAFLEAVTDAASFIEQADAAIKAKDPESKTIAADSTNAENATYSSLVGKTEDLSKWVFDAARAVGDKTIIDEGDGAYLIVLLTVLPHKDMSAESNNVRHILIEFPKDDAGKTVELTDEIKNKTKAEAQEILDEYLKNPTEDNFAALAKEKSADPGSKDNGGLYEDITKSTNFVKPFLNWSTAEGRKTGDTGIVETEYGYHIMYYVSGTGVAWSGSIKSEIVSDQYNAYFDDVTAKYVDSFNFGSYILNYAVKKQCKQISKIVARNYAK